MRKSQLVSEATEEELVLFKEEGDEAGQVDALRTLADFYTSARTKSGQMDVDESFFQRAHTCNEMVWSS